MARHKLSKEDRLKGVERALANRKTPKQLRPGLERSRDRLREELGLPAVGLSR